MPRDLEEVLGLVVKFAALAESDNEHEAHNSALHACRLLLKHRDELLAGAQKLATLAKAHPISGRSRIHSNAQRQREWNAFFRKHRLCVFPMTRSLICLACGEPCEQGARAIWRSGVGATHLECAPWWRGYSFSREEDDGIPF